MGEPSFIIGGLQHRHVDEVRIRAALDIVRGSRVRRHVCSPGRDLLSALMVRWGDPAEV